MESPRKRSFGTITEDPYTAPEVKIEITTNLFVVISVFRNCLYIHVRKYANRYPTKEGVAMSLDEWKFACEVLCRESDKKINAPFASIIVKRNKNKTATLTSMVKGTTVLLTDTAVANVKSRYV